MGKVLTISIQSSNIPDDEAQLRHHDRKPIRNKELEKEFIDLLRTFHSFLPMLSQYTTFVSRFELASSRLRFILLMAEHNEV